MMRLLSLFVVALLLGGATQAAAAEPPELAKARTLYNAGSYDEAIAAASEVRSTDWLAAAQIVIARSYLDRFRRSSQPDDLMAGRRALMAAAGVPLMPRDRVDLLIGLGESLYFSDEYGAAAGVFDNALAEGFLLNRRDRLLLLDWWATAEDRAAQAHVNDRPSRFERLRDRMEQELRRDAENPIANYWLVVAARGSGDIQGAWDAAVAAWARSWLFSDGADTLRGDLDRLVTQAIIPERSRLQKDADAGRALRDQWNSIKEQWK